LSRVSSRPLANASSAIDISASLRLVIAVVAVLPARRLVLFVAVLWEDGDGLSMPLMAVPRCVTCGIDGS